MMKTASCSCKHQSDPDCGIDFMWVCLTRRRCSSSSSMPTKWRSWSTNIHIRLFSHHLPFPRDLSSAFQQTNGALAFVPDCHRPDPETERASGEVNDHLCSSRRVDAAALVARCVKRAFLGQILVRLLWRPCRRRRREPKRKTIAAHFCAFKVL